MTNRQKVALETKEKIIEIGGKLINEKGFDNVSVEDITAACGVAKGTFYTYFKRKEDLVFAAGLPLFDKVEQDISLMNGVSASDKIRHYCKYFMEAVESAGLQMCREWVKVTVDPNVAPKEWEISKLDYDTAALTRIFVSIVNSGDLTSDFPLEASVKLIISELYGMMICWCMSDGKFDPKDWVDTFCDLQMSAVIQPYLRK